MARKYHKLAKSDLSKYKIIAKKKPRKKQGNKYNATKKKVDGILFDSKKEARVYQELKRWEKEGRIKDFKVHPSYLIQEREEIEVIGTLRTGKVGKKKVIMRPIHYIPDFEFWDNEWNRKRIIDVKGVATEVYKVKRKLFNHMYKPLYVENQINYGLQTFNRNRV